MEMIWKEAVVVQPRFLLQFNWGKQTFSVRIARVLAVQDFSQVPLIHQSKSLTTIPASLAVSQGRTGTEENI
jgi:hypothetical protein